MSYDLAITERCLVEDLRIKNLDVLAVDPAEFVQESFVIEKFVRDRRTSPVGQDQIGPLSIKSIAGYSLHAGPDRGLTWYDERHDVVWLLASRFHRSGKKDDSYPYFRGLSRTELAPSQDDYKRLFERRAATFAKALQEEVPPARQLAFSHPNQIHTVTIGGRVDVRFALDASGPPPPMMILMINQRLRPGPLKLPSEWSTAVAASFMPDLEIADLELTAEILGSPGQQDELGFCGLVEE